MNRNASGDEFTAGELRTLALDHDCMAADKLDAALSAVHSANGQMSLLLGLTRDVRFHLWSAGTHGYSLRTSVRTPADTTITVDTELLAALTG